MTEKELFISWLNDAYSTELAMMPVLENHANDARDYPEIYERQMQHLEETRRQAERLETMIKSLGGKVSVVKSITGKTLGLGKSVSTGIFSDEMIKNFLADYTAEHLEIASYKSLIAAARHVGEKQCIPVLEEILAEELAMAAWLKEHIPMATVESFKTAASDSNDRSSKKSSGTKRRASGLLKPSGLVTLLGIGAVGAGVTMLMSASENKNQAGQSKRGLENAHSRSLENAHGAGDSFPADTDNIAEVGVIVTETVIATDDPEVILMRDRTNLND
jgi:ferritin-like metal-binding protein YciE